MANRTSGPRGRSRKARPTGTAATPAGAGASTTTTAATTGSSSTDRSQPPRSSPAGSRASAPRSGNASRAGVAATTYGERPPAPWHPLPISEVLIFAGTIAFVVALTRGGAASGVPLLLAGIGAVVLGTLEVTWREHRSGFRSHALLLALFPVVLLHSLVILGLSALTEPPRIVNLAMLVVDAAVYLLLFKLLRAQFQTARARRVARA
jgi:hypothetical protein